MKLSDAVNMDSRFPSILHIADTLILVDLRFR